ncbi:uncharacterized protein B0H18DRAFT_995518 [Fomitopsis serialis]|uniref:uncharacterized protein n=1 Tax=Fomitopsis serialis TaxID=139415 RepID=UPI002007CBEE|nr:uncharacterized protein B0H18DRAFT_995518 [Neoantrodia serialis]KAH9930163.1 hypothetical protein B0H18DRAFT_995518 [Neoantrodia serialis]
MQPTREWATASDNTVYMDRHTTSMRHVVSMSRQQVLRTFEGTLKCSWPSSRDVPTLEKTLRQPHTRSHAPFTVPGTAMYIQIDVRRATSRTWSAPLLSASFAGPRVKRYGPTIKVERGTDITTSGERHKAQRRPVHTHFLLAPSIPMSSIKKAFHRTRESTSSKSTICAKSPDSSPTVLHILEALCAVRYRDAQDDGSPFSDGAMRDSAWQIAFHDVRAVWCEWRCTLSADTPAHGHRTALTRYIRYVATVRQRLTAAAPLRAYSLRPRRPCTGTHLVRYSPCCVFPGRRLPLRWRGGTSRRRE